MSALPFVVGWIIAWWIVTDTLRDLGMSWSTLTMLASLWGVVGVVIYLNNFSSV